MINNPGPQLGNYRLLQKLGSGGFADVYLGEHIQGGAISMHSVYPLARLSLNKSVV